MRKYLRRIGEQNSPFELLVGLASLALIGYTLYEALRLWLF